MTIYAVKRDSETNERLIKRFKKQVQNSRIIQEVRTRKYHTATPKKRITRIKAIMREQFREKRAKEQFYA